MQYTLEGIVAFYGFRVAFFLIQEILRHVDANEANVTDEIAVRKARHRIDEIVEQHAKEFDHLSR